MGSSSPEMTLAPAAPKVSKLATQYGETLPQIIEIMKGILPDLFGTQLSAMQQYSPQMTQVAADIQKQLYPETYALQENLAKIASQGMTQGAPSSVMDEYRNMINSRLGYNNASPVAADYASREMLNMNESWKRYYQDLALGVSNKLPVVNPVSPSMPDLTSGFNFPTMLNYSSDTYGKQMANSAWTPGTNWLQLGMQYGAAPAIIGSMIA